MKKEQNWQKGKLITPSSGNRDVMAELNTTCPVRICDGSGIVDALVSIETRLPLKGMAAGSDVYTCECVIKAKARAKYQALMAASNVHMYSNHTLANYEPANKTQRDAVRLILQGLDGFYLFGPPGVGKTHLGAGTVFREVAKGRPAAIISMPSLVQEFRESKTRSKLEELAYTIPYLVIDDIDKVNFTPMIEEMMFRLVDARWLLYKKGRGHTSFTSQVPRDRVDDSTAWLGQILNHAIQDRIRGLTINIFIDGESQRGKR